MNKLFYNIGIIVVLLAGIAAIIFIQFSIPTLIGADGYLHIRMAEFIKNSGPIHDFHWARLSVFSRYFADKDFLYHLMLIPFTFAENIFWGAKLAATFFGILFLGVFFFVLRKYSQPALIPLALLAVFLSSRFVHAMARPRPMLFVISLTLLAIYFLIEKKIWGIFIVTVIYCLGHVSGPFMLLYALLTETVRFFSQKKFYLKTIIAVFSAILISYFVHPNFPNNFLVFYLNAIVVPIYAVKWGLELGAEFFPLSTREFLLSYPLVVLGLLLMLALAIFARPRTKFATQVIFAFTAVFLFFSFLSRRYMIHGYPLFLLLLASYFSDYFQQNPWSQIQRKNRVFALASVVMLGLVFIVLCIISATGIRNQLRTDKIVNTHFENAGKFLRENVPEGELIFHSNWSDSQYFIGLNPKNDYFVTLDPIYMFWWDPKNYNLYRDVAFGRSKDPYFFLKDTFGVTYGYAGKNYFGGLIEQVRKDRRFKILAEDGLGIIFALK